MNKSKPRRIEDQLKDLRAKLNRLERDGLRIDSQKPKQPAQSGQESADKSASISPKPITYARALPVTSPASQRKKVPAKHIRLEDCVPGTESVAPSGHGYYQVVNPVCDIEGAGDLDGRFADRVAVNDSPLRQRIARHIPVEYIDRDKFIFVDIETAGLGSSPLFLIGAMFWADGGFTVKQFLARNYAEEAAVIAGFSACASSRPVLVTFNGKSFDIPYIRARGIATGTVYTPSPLHLDLLHISRRLWKDRLPNCKLQTLETSVCGRSRHEDIPGNEIPDAYHAFVRTGNAWQIGDIIRHNMLDLVTLADIMTRFPKA